jgi:hypothetical protein
LQELTMFGWWSSDKCPLPDTSRAWVERRMAWVGQTFGTDRMRQAVVVTPTPEFFPDEYDGSTDAGDRLFGRVCDFAGVERSRVRLAWVDHGGGRGRRDQPVVVNEDGNTSTASGTYLAGDWSRQEVITVDRHNLGNPMQLVATAAHELCHVHLLGDGHVSPDEPDHEPLTDLLTVCLGLGIFGANASVHDGGWSEGNMAGWSVGRLGYLGQTEWAYALSVFAWVRGEEQPAWSKHLRPDVRKAFRQGARYLARHGVSERSLLD